MLSEYHVIDSVWSVRLSNRKWAVMVKMSDGGLSAEYFAVVDPVRGGDVAFYNLCRVQKVEGDFVTLAFYTTADWETLVGGADEEAPRVKPRKVERVDSKKALRGKVILNGRTQ